ISPSVAWLITRVDLLSLAYRYYTQSEANFYQPRYTESSQVNGYLTRDKELSALYSHQLSLESTHTFELGGTGAYAFTLGARASLARFRYLAFLGLTRVHALEATLLLGFALR
ncbi:MAG TPA: DUF3570 domain-containing protein, partial [Polyangiaceae bacterium]|nr:DUF3570 domain-containing protein [Polyangiaceae bacterium]